ncbi:SRPBCC family protein [Halocatena halophila]|uniref:SRPBCC family protein n=1 Tax=Halocatena halophila TaxID=2814576 RepID=UPI002ED2F979
MSAIDRQCRVRVPIAAVWALYASIDGLRALTPSVFGLQIETIQSPVGTSPDDLPAGSEITLSFRPFLVGPRIRVATTITERQHTDTTAWFVDSMDSGLFERWEHYHLCYGDGESTIVRDRIAYRLSDRVAWLDPFVRAMIGVGLRYRHWRTRRECTP